MKKEVQIDISDDTFMTLAKIAHERDITLNQLVNDILREQLMEKTITLEEFEKNFDEIMKCVEEKKSVYIIKDQGVALLPWEIYEGVSDQSSKLD